MYVVYIIYIRCIYPHIFDTVYNIQVPTFLEGFFSSCTGVLRNAKKHISILFGM